jgi:hypothetical protein
MRCAEMKVPRQDRDVRMQQERDIAEHRAIVLEIFHAWAFDAAIVSSHKLAILEVSGRPMQIFLRL